MILRMLRVLLLLLLSRCPAPRLPDGGCRWLSLSLVWLLRLLVRSVLAVDSVMAWWMHLLVLSLVVAAVCSVGIAHLVLKISVTAIALRVLLSHVVRAALCVTLRRTHVRMTLYGSVRTSLVLDLRADPVRGRVGSIVLLRVLLLLLLLLWVIVLELQLHS